MLKHLRLPQLRFGEEFGHRRKAAAVDGAGAKLFELFQMEGRGIALVLLKAIARMRKRQFIHHAVTRDLGNDGGRRNGERLRIAFHNCGCRVGEKLGHMVAVNQAMGRFRCQRLHRFGHGIASQLFHQVGRPGIALLGHRYFQRGRIVSLWRIQQNAFVSNSLDF